MVLLIQKSFGINAQENGMTNTITNTKKRYYVNKYVNGLRPRTSSQERTGVTEGAKIPYFTIEHAQSCTRRYVSGKKPRLEGLDRDNRAEVGNNSQSTQHSQTTSQSCLRRNSCGK